MANCHLFGVNQRTASCLSNASSCTHITGIGSSGGHGENQGLPGGRPLPPRTQKLTAPILNQRIRVAFLDGRAATFLNPDIELVLHHSKSFEDTQTAKFVHGVQNPVAHI